MIEYSYKPEGETVDATMEMIFNSFDIPAISAPVDADEYEEIPDS